MNDLEYATLREFLMRADVVDAAARAQWKTTAPMRWRDLEETSRDVVRLQVRVAFRAVLKRAARDASIARHPAGRRLTPSSNDGHDDGPIGVPLTSFSRHWVCNVVRNGYYNFGVTTAVIPAGAKCTPLDPHDDGDCGYRTEASLTDEQLSEHVQRVTPLHVRT
jgi:hypothetical protein